MAWQRIPNLKGLIYIPEPLVVPKKHPCPDCSACQYCSSERCRLCQAKTPGAESGNEAAAL